MCVHACAYVYVYACVHVCHLKRAVCLPVEHEGEGGELGGGVDGGAEQEGDGVQEVLPLRLPLRHHAGDGVVQQPPRGVVQRVQLLGQWAHLLGEVPALTQQRRHLVDTQGTAEHTGYARGTSFS